MPAPEEAARARLQRCRRMRASPDQHEGHGLKTWAMAVEHSWEPARWAPFAGIVRIRWWRSPSGLIGFPASQPESVPQSRHVDLDGFGAPFRTPSLALQVHLQL